MGVEKQKRLGCSFDLLAILFFLPSVISSFPPGPSPRSATELANPIFLSTVRWQSQYGHCMTGFTCKLNYQFYPNASLLHRKNSGIQTQAVLQTPFGPSTMKVSVLQGYHQMALVSILTHTFCQLLSLQTSMAMDQKKNLSLSLIFILKKKGEKTQTSEVNFKFPLFRVEQ